MQTGDFTAEAERRFGPAQTEADDNDDLFGGYDDDTDTDAPEEVDAKPSEVKPARKFAVGAFDPAKVLGDAGLKAAQAKATKLEESIEAETDLELRDELINDLADVQYSLDDQSESFAFRSMDEAKLDTVKEDATIAEEASQLELEAVSEKYGKDSATAAKAERKYRELLEARIAIENEQTARRNKVIFEESFRRIGAKAVAEGYQAEKVQALEKAKEQGVDPWQLMQVEAKYAAPVETLEDYEQRVKAAQAEAKAEILGRVRDGYVERLRARYALPEPEGINPWASKSEGLTISPKMPPAEKSSPFDDYRP